jgi:outer membrane lipoprotein
MNRFSLFAAIGLLLCGCVTVPKAISIEDDNLLVPFAQAVAAPKASKGMAARWGGTIAAVSNQAERTLIEIVQFPLRTDGRPVVDGEQSGGRFRAYINGFVEPTLWAVGKVVTVRGHIADSEVGKVGDYAYTFPVLAVDGFHLWAPQQGLRYPDRRYCDPFYDSFCDPYWYHRDLYWRHRGPVIWPR